jgi:hypothetical protein
MNILKYLKVFKKVYVAKLNAVFYHNFYLFLNQNILFPGLKLLPGPVTVQLYE